MTNEQKITQHRIVTYRDEEGRDWPAIVTRVIGDPVIGVDLTVFCPFANQGTFVASSVREAPDPADKAFGEGGAAWPPNVTWRWPERG